MIIELLVEIVSNSILGKLLDTKTLKTNFVLKSNEKSLFLLCTGCNNKTIPDEPGVQQIDEMLMDLDLYCPCELPQSIREQVNFQN